MAILGSLLGICMSWCYNLVKNYGLAIILFTLFSKIILLPVSIWVQFNSIKMVKMQPELNRIKINYYGDKDTIAEETQKLYKKNHYHAMASIIPLFIQIILLLGVVSVIYHPMNYILHVDNSITTRFEEVAVENDSSINPESSSIQLSVCKQIQAGNTDSYYALRDEFTEETITETIQEVNDLNMNFLGFDLSWIPSKDGGLSITVPLIAGLSAWLLSFCQNKMNVLQAASSKISNLATMGVSVGISLYLGFFVPSGVALYWISSNLLTIVQQYLLNKAINPKKYVNWKELEETRKELESLNSNKKKRKWNDPLTKRCKEDYKKFLSLGNKHLVFYSESNGFYKYYAGTIQYILDHTDIPLHYITSDPDDNIFEMAKENDQIKPYYIDSQKLITLMMRMDADVVVMTMPDLETFQIKRSYVRKDVEYIYIPHCTNSLNLTMRKGCVDYFDAILATGKHQSEEFEKMQELHHIENQTIVHAGYPLLDDLYNDYQEMLKKHGMLEETTESSNDEKDEENTKQEEISTISDVNEDKEQEEISTTTDTNENNEPEEVTTVVESKKTVLIAPSWQKDNIVDSCLDDILDGLKDKDFNIIVRPHPQHVRHQPEKMEYLKDKYKENTNITIQTDFSSNETIYMADAIITDWSGIAYEYAFTTLKPVLFIDTPMKIMNPDYEELGIVPFNIWLREKIGGVVKLDEIETVPERIQELLDNPQKYNEQIKKYRDEYDYNFLHSGEASARYIIHEVLKKIAIKKEEENA